MFRFMRMFCRSLFVLFLLLIAFCPFDLRILAIHLVYSNSSRNHLKLKYCVHLIDIPHYIFLPVQNQDFDFHRLILCFLCAIFWGERWLFVLFWYCPLCWQALFKLSVHTDIQSAIIFVLSAYNDIHSAIILVLLT
jgi:hypothetical protein